MNISVLTDWGERELRKSLTMMPAVLNRRSHGTLVAGIVRMRWATSDSTGYVAADTRHHCSGSADFSSTGLDRYAPAPAQQGVTTLGSHPFPTTALTLSQQPPAAASTPVSYSRLQRIDSKRETPSSCWHDWSTGQWFVSHDSDDIAAQRYHRDKSRLWYRRSEKYATTS